MRKSLLFVAVGLLFCGSAKAQFWVSDVGQYIRDAVMIANQGEQVSTDIKTTTNTGATATNTGKWLTLADQVYMSIETAKYGGLRTLPWQLFGLLGHDLYGHASPLVRSLNGGGGAQGAYAYAVSPVVPDNGTYYASEAPQQAWREDSNYALVQAADAIVPSSFGAVSDANQQIPISQVAITNLTNDTLSTGFVQSNPQMSEIANLQKTSIGVGMDVQTNLENQQLLSKVVAELGILVAFQRNALADKLNSDALAHQQAVKAQASVGGLKAAIESFSF